MMRIVKVARYRFLCYTIIMIEKIYIPTVNRVDNQITYNGLSDSLKERVVMVVQSWERDQYNYDCEYLVLPEEINLDDYLCLAKTRDYIYKDAGTIKYCVLDDDLIFKRRNQKYFKKSGLRLEADMKISKRVCTDDDLEEMFNLYDNLLDVVSYCGGCRIGLPPAESNDQRHSSYLNNSPVFSQLFLNGADIYEKLEELNTTKIRYNEDVLFLLSILTSGLSGIESQQFGFQNSSTETKEVSQTVWEETTHEQVWKDHKVIENLFPRFFKIILDEDGNRVPGGFRNYGKTQIDWGKAHEYGKHKHTTFQSLFA